MVHAPVKSGVPVIWLLADVVLPVVDAELVVGNTLASNVIRWNTTSQFLMDTSSEKHESCGDRWLA